MQSEEMDRRESVDDVSVMWTVAGVFTMIVFFIATLSAYLADEFTWMISGIIGAALGLAMNFVLMTTLTNVVQRCRGGGALRIESNLLPSNAAFDHASVMTLISGAFTILVFMFGISYAYLSDDIIWVSGIIAAAIALALNLIVMHVSTCLIQSYRWTRPTRVELKVGP